MEILIYILAAFIVLIAILNFLAPKNYHVSRSIEIKRPLPEVFGFVSHLRNQEKWSPWESRDPHMKKEYFGIDGKPGFTSKWVGNKQVGEGEQEITNIIENESMESKLRFLKPWKSQSDCYIKVLEQSPDSTRVTWGFSGDHHFPMNIMMLFMSMDKMIGKDFDEGLRKLKSYLESK